MPNAADIKLIVFDVDGVLTDGSIIVDDHGVETKRFHVRDGLAMHGAMELGLHVGVLTGRSSRAVTLRMAEIGIDLLIQGVRDRAVGLETLCQRVQVELDQSAYVGDDLLDLPAILRCGYPIAVADAVAEIKSAARHVTEAPGGRAAAREAIEHVLKAQGRWDELVERFGI